MSHNFDFQGLGGRIHFHRRRLGLTQTMLAEKLHISFQAISGWENAASLPDIENLCKLSAIFGVSLDDLLKGDNDHRTVMIGIDGGATKTEFALFDQSGAVLERIRLSGCNASLVGPEETLRILMQGIDLCLKKNPYVSGAFVGIAGPKLDVIFQKLSERYPQMHIKVASDGVNAFRSAEGDFALICGTGSILITPDGDGYRFIGGWGARFGDHGSAYNFGRAALCRGFAFENGIAEPSLLYYMLLKKTGFPQLLSYASHESVPYIAGLSTAVFEAYDRGCPEATAIIHDEMQNLARLLDSAMPAGGRLVVCGGIMEHHASLLLPMLSKLLTSPITFVQPTLPPIYGACVACCEEMDISRDGDFDKQFALDYRRLLQEQKK